MKTLLAFLCSLLMLSPLQGYSNAAQPGIFDAGGMANFVLLFPGDSSAFRRIQMIDEKITIQLYRGFAVVKGEYQMFNTADTTLSIRVGYPVNSHLKSATEFESKVTRIFFDQLYALKSYTDGKENALLIQPARERMSLEENNWYIWSSSFSPKDTTILTVYFIVNTNNALIREGNVVDKNNGFIYLLETGATWKQPILKGEIKIGLMDQLMIRDIRGLSPTNIFRVNSDNNTLFYRFSNLSPTFENNVVITYTPEIENFDFGYISQKRQLLFGSIDSFAKQPIDETRFTDYTFENPYVARAVKFGNIFRFGAIAGLSIIGGILLVWLVRTLIRHFRSQRPAKGTEI